MLRRAPVFSAGRPAAGYLRRAHAAAGCAEPEPAYVQQVSQFVELLGVQHPFFSDLQRLASAGQLECSFADLHLLQGQKADCFRMFTQQAGWGRDKIGSCQNDPRASAHAPPLAQEQHEQYKAGQPCQQYSQRQSGGTHIAGQLVAMVQLINLSTQQRRYQAANESGYLQC